MSFFVKLGHMPSRWDYSEFSIKFIGLKSDANTCRRSATGKRSNIKTGASSLNNRRSFFPGRSAISQGDVKSLDSCMAHVNSDLQECR